MIEHKSKEKTKQFHKDGKDEKQNKAEEEEIRREKQNNQRQV